VSPEPFVPYTIAAVELAEEHLVVLGQMADGVDLTTLAVGMEVELELGTLYHEDGTDYLVWKWRPVDSAPAPGTPAGEVV